jgi:hypothetical protein
VAEQLILDMACHDALANDLFVTTNPELLERRWSDGWGAGVGICDPLEAIGLVEALLRSRRRFVLHISEKSTTDIDSTGFYADLVRHRLPTLHKALASCLSPSRRDAARPVALMAESIASRYRDLLIAQDNLFRLAQVEGYLGGSNNLASEQMYHVQNSLVLFSGTLDVLADITREIQGQAVHQHEVGWTRLLSAKGWGSKLTDPSAIAMRAEAARLHVDQCIPTVLALRNTYGHSAPLRSGVAEFRDEYGLTKACYTLISLSDSLNASPLSTDQLFGLLHIGSKLFLIPHLFQQGLVASLAGIINDLLGATHWPHDDWVDREPDADWPRIQAEYRWRSERAGWLFRP